MNDEQMQTMDQIRAFLADSEAMEFSVEGTAALASSRRRAQ